MPLAGHACQETRAGAARVFPAEVSHRFALPASCLPLDTLFLISTLVFETLFLESVRRPKWPKAVILCLCASLQLIFVCAWRKCYLQGEQCRKTIEGADARAAGGLGAAAVVTVAAA